MKWLGDETKSTFHHVWTQLVDGLREGQLTENALRDLLTDQMNKSKSRDIVHHMDNYEHALNPNDPNRSYH